jgi:hypothetical protein
VLITLAANSDLSLPDGIIAVKCSIEVLNAAQIAAQTSEAAGGLVPLKDLEDTPGFEPVLTVLLDAEPDCRARRLVSQLQP